VALILKTVGSPLEEVHEGIAGRRGWVTLTNEKARPSAGRRHSPRMNAGSSSTSARPPGAFPGRGLAFGRSDMVRALGRPSCWPPWRRSG
jgi:hypothetical protein